MNQLTFGPNMICQARIIYYVCKTCKIFLAPHERVIIDGNVYCTICYNHNQTQKGNKSC